MSDDKILKIAIEEDGKVKCDPSHVSLAMESVFPLCAQGKGKKWRFIGTAFFINHLSMFVTAKHVIDEYIDGRSSSKDDALCAFVVRRDNTLVILPVIHACIHVTADVAVGRIAQIQNRATGEIRHTTSFPITLNAPSIGGQVFTFAYPQMEVDASQSPQRFKIAPWFYHGFVSHHYPSGRDKVMLPGNVYETSITIKGGASGGPVYDESGCIIGINSTGIDGTDISYVSSINDIMDLFVGNLSLPDGTHRETMTIRELAEYGAVKIK